MGLAAGLLGEIEGTIHTELSTAAPQRAQTIDVAAMAGPSGFVVQHTSECFRRTEIPRSTGEFERRGIEVALETRDMTDPGLRLYPNPSWEHCSGCPYRAPCLVMTQGLDETPVLEASYRKRAGPDFEPGRLGSVWGFVPEVYRVAEHPGTGGSGS